MTDIVTRLRNWREVHLARLHLLMEEAADEMERLSANGDCPKPDNAAKQDILQAEVRRLKAVIAARQPALTDEERESLTRAVTECERVAREYGIKSDERRARALRGLLERLRQVLVQENTTPP